MIRTTPLRAKAPASPRLRKCKVCRAAFPPRSMTHKACSPDCALALAQQQRAKEERNAFNAIKAAAKTRQQWLREAQQAFNAYIRARDHELPCISCGRYHDGAYDAGHYRSVGAAPALRFHEDNVNRQCVPCNQHKAGNVIEYRLGLLKRIGAARLAFLEGPHEPRHYTIEDARAIKAEYKAKLKELNARFMEGTLRA